MVSKSNFDELIRKEMRGVKSQHGDDQQQAARDTVAARLNKREGKKHRSTAYKPSDDPKPRRGTSKSRGGGGGGGGGRRGVPTPTGRPSGLPETGPTLEDRPGLPQVDDQDDLWPLLSILARRLLMRKGVDDSAPADPNDPRAPKRVPNVAGESIDPANMDVRLQRDPNPGTGLDPNRMLPVDPNPAQLPPPPLQLPYSQGEAPALTEGGGRMMTDDEIGDIKDRMYPGVPRDQPGNFNELNPRIRNPGWFKR